MYIIIDIAWCTVLYSYIWLLPDPAWRPLRLRRITLWKKKLGAPGAEVSWAQERSSGPVA